MCRPAAWSCMPTLPSADFCQAFPIPFRISSPSVDRQADLPGYCVVTFTLMPATYTSMLSVQVWDFEDIGLLIQNDRLLCGFCSSGQCFACGFLQIPPHGGHPCRPAYGS